MDIYKWLVQSGTLPRVKKPSRYIGKELNSLKKVNEKALKVLLAFPDTYEIGMSHIGLKLLYSILNKEDDIIAERAYLPWKDMIAEMKNAGVPLYSLESYTPARDFHILGITLQYELSFTNVLKLLELSDIPIFQKDRTKEPLVIGGGPCTSNPEPVADFFDLLVVGDGEVVMLEVAKLVKENLGLLKLNKRKELLEMLSRIPGVYVPSLPKRKIHKGLVKDLNDHEIIPSSIVPFMSVVHDRAVIEIMRGCNRGCRFCQAGMFYRPVRERNIEKILQSIEPLISTTGYEELSFLSLSTMDYSKIEELTSRSLKYLKNEHVGLSLPSTRVDSFGVEMAEKIASIRKTGLTFAPEAGTQRLRNVINKNVTEENILSAISSAIEKGWKRVKLYFMIGLPTETDEDVNGIVELSRKIKALGLKQLTVSVSIFVPKPHTPFQYARQITPPEARKKFSILSKIKRFAQLQLHDPGKSFVEGLLSRGDRKVAKAIYCAYKDGSLFDEWGEEFSLSTWMNAFEKCQIDIQQYTRERSVEEELPWDHISLGISKKFLLKEYEKALKGELTQDCRWSGCTLCGVCQEYRVTNVLN
ncbi:radical SAM protein [Kosmotoga arenicorallina S304]|uniref:Radical SAM protein n=1 Tax=Kosmotoga arenicorallina S304 TaxID=1453497 RepID=A0A176K391_9BACT|nr:TIGR03960 family B12-binding radical SAM protein [Kosmotoga arenicorallina]OAA31413.1 radical SAM protein [Kosmotoga arenicorallina S304]